ncbi:MAG: HNH endonuclease [Pirellulales bacterium]|nr:HNH endonuclease [Pirellulales bacterium]
MDPALRKLVRDRAKRCCEYCLLAQEDSLFVSFHVEHIVPRKHGGADEPDNLALACVHCNLHKGPNLAGIDPLSADLTRLFHPRKDSWIEHFSIDQDVIVGRTAIGRTTVAVLNMNGSHQVELRRLLHRG